MSALGSNSNSRKKGGAARKEGEGGCRSGKNERQEEGGEKRLERISRPEGLFRGGDGWGKEVLALAWEIEKKRV